MKIKAAISILMVLLVVASAFMSVAYENNSYSSTVTENEELKPSPFVTCFKEGTKITMADGTYKNIEDIKTGDRILSYDIEKHKFTSWTVKNVEFPNRPVYNINDGALYVTEDHPLLIKKPNGEIGWGQIKIMPHHVRLKGQKILQIEVGDKLFTQDEKWVEIKSITYNNTVVKCVNIFSYSGTKNYFANGFLAYEEYPPLPYMLRYRLYRFFERVPFLSQFKDMFLF